MSSPTACWLDGDTCPYGLPNGRFIDRPLWICNTHKGGCPKLTTDHQAELTRLLEGPITIAARKLVETVFEDEERTLAAELKLIAAVTKNKVSSAILQAAALALVEHEQHLSAAEIEEDKIIRKGDVHLQFKF
ncbi:MAG: hypothetical protein Q7S32_04915 [bacterium]|nr:hypothetical protein [bacterium]